MSTYLPLANLSLANLSLAKKSVYDYSRPIAIGLFAAVFLSACTDGGGAGDFVDFDNNPEAVERVTPFVGLYDLPDNWSGFPDNEAFLEIQEPDNAGVALALINRLSSTENCIESRRETGDVFESPFDNDDRVFLDDIIELENAILILTGNDLTISLPEDVSDIDNDDDFDEPASLFATRLGIMATDLPADCQ